MSNSYNDAFIGNKGRMEFYYAFMHTTRAIKRLACGVYTPLVVARLEIIH